MKNSYSNEPIRKLSAYDRLLVLSLSEELYDMCEAAIRLGADIDGCISFCEYYGLYDAKYQLKLFKNRFTNR